MCPVSDRRWKQQRKFLFFSCRAPFDSDWWLLQDSLHKLSLCGGLWNHVTFVCSSFESMWLVSTSSSAWMWSSAAGTWRPTCILRCLWLFRVLLDYSVSDITAVGSPDVFLNAISQWERTTFYCSFCFSSEDDFEWSRSINWLLRAGN